MICYKPHLHTTITFPADEYGDRSVCQCAMGYSGDTCDDMIGCDGVVCRNGGRCVEEKTARFTCE